MRTAFRSPAETKEECCESSWISSGWSWMNFLRWSAASSVRTVVPSFHFLSKPNKSLKSDTVEPLREGWPYGSEAGDRATTRRASENRCGYRSIGRTNRLWQRSTLAAWKEIDGSVGAARGFGKDEEVLGAEAEGTRCGIRPTGILRSARLLDLLAFGGSRRFLRNLHSAAHFRVGGSHLIGDFGPSALPFKNLADVLAKFAVVHKASVFHPSAASTLTSG